MTNVTISLPDDLAQQAKSAGLLQPEAIESLLREAMRKHQVDHLFSTMGKLAALEPGMTEEEIESEIAAARAERARRR
jgi:hypothetical protein